MISFSLAVPSNSSQTDAPDSHTASNGHRVCPRDGDKKVPLSSGQSRNFGYGIFIPGPDNGRGLEPPHSQNRSSLERRMDPVPLSVATSQALSLIVDYASFRISFHENNNLYALRMRDLDSDTGYRFEEYRRAEGSRDLNFLPQTSDNPSFVYLHHDIWSPTYIFDPDIMIRWIDGVRRGFRGNPQEEKAVSAIYSMVMQEASPSQPQHLQDLRTIVNDGRTGGLGMDLDLSVAYNRLLSPYKVMRYPDLSESVLNGLHHLLFDQNYSTMRSEVGNRLIHYFDTYARRIFGVITLGPHLAQWLNDYFANLARDLLEEIYIRYHNAQAHVTMLQQLEARLEAALRAKAEQRLREQRLREQRLWAPQPQQPPFPADIRPVRPVDPQHGNQLFTVQEPFGGSQMGPPSYPPSQRHYLANSDPNPNSVHSQRIDFPPPGQAPGQ